MLFVFHGVKLGQAQGHFHPIYALPSLEDQRHSRVRGKAV